MAVYRCAECDTWKDDDYFPCEAHPQNPSSELICPACMVELDITTAEFNKDQLDFIKLQENLDDNEAE